MKEYRDLAVKYPSFRQRSETTARLRVQGPELRIHGLRCRVLDSEFRVQGLGVRI
jgi:hypothetical protein